jgi:formylglycine-generating enzyme required for sulfatase activity
VEDLLREQQLIRGSLADLQREKRRFRRNSDLVDAMTDAGKDRISLKSLKQILEFVSKSREDIMRIWRETGLGMEDWSGIVSQVSGIDNNDNTTTAFFRTMTRPLRQTVSEIEDLADHLNRVVAGEAVAANPDLADIVLQYTQLFPMELTKRYYVTKLKQLGVDWTEFGGDSFFQTLSHATGVSLNESGHLEGIFPNGTVMVYIPRGPFTMGMPYEAGAQDESPAHRVYVSGYWISKHETTFAQFDRFCDETGRRRPHDNGFGRRHRPVINVTWRDAEDYCRWLTARSGVTFRLPRECEWEKAARGGSHIEYPWGDQTPDGTKANFADVNLLYKYEENNPPTSKEEHRANMKWMNRDIDDHYAYTAPVGKYPMGASPYGVMDMAGNVWEMVGDWYDGDYYQNSPAKDPAGPIRGNYRVTRGGGWDSHQWMLRSTGRAGGIPQKAGDSLGFRVVMSHDTQ